MTNDFIFPEYNGKNFINIINSIKHNFGINDGITLENKKIKKISLNQEKGVFILVSGFGWEFYNILSEIIS